VELVLSYYGNGRWKDCSDMNSHHETQFLALDITKAESYLDWIPLWSTEEALKYTVDWYKKFQTANVYSLCLDQISIYTEKWKSKKVK
jgi:CDP-glucose 4,6-dehydratase